MTISAITLDHILTLVGPLGDGSRHDQPAARLRQFLQERIRAHEALAGFLDEARRRAGQGATQFNKALQDLVNVAGQRVGYVYSIPRRRGAGPRPGPAVRGAEDGRRCMRRPRQARRRGAEWD